MAVTLSALRDRVLDRADMTGSGFAVQARVNEYINSEAAELYDILVATFEDYFYSTSDISLVSGTESYSLPSDFMKVLRVFYKTGNSRYPLKRFSLEQIDRYATALNPAVADGHYLWYRVMGDKIFLSPEPQVSGSIELWYVPKYTEMDDVTNTSLTFTLPNEGWIEMVVLGAAARLLMKEESDPSQLFALKADIRNRIINSAEERDLGEPNVIRDAYARPPAAYSGLKGFW